MPSLGRNHFGHVQRSHFGPVLRLSFFDMYVFLLVLSTCRSFLAPPYQQGLGRCKKIDRDLCTLAESTHRLSMSMEVSDSNSASERNLGRPHTEESRAKISKANKGKTPWNSGKQHSEETKRKIAEKTKIAMMRRKEDKALSLGFLSLDEYEEYLRSQKQKAKDANEEIGLDGKKRRKGGLTEEGRMRISESLKQRWQDPGFRERYSASNKYNRNHTDETRARISNAIKLKWKDDEYRSKIESFSPSEEVKKKISDTLKAKWLDPGFRERMMNSTFERTAEWRESISAKIKAKWEDPQYRQAVSKAIRRTYGESSRLIVAGATRKSRSSKKSRLSAEERVEIAREKREIKAFKNAEDKVSKERIRNAKRMVREGTDQNIKDIIGNKLWFEEKMKRSKTGSGFSDFMDDETLEKILVEEWKCEEDGSDEDALLDEGDNGDYLIERRNTKQNGDTYDHLDDEDGIDLGELDYVDEIYDDDDFMDIIEVYNEDGELVATYDASEYDKLKKLGK